MGNVCSGGDDVTTDKTAKAAVRANQATPTKASGQQPSKIIRDQKVRDVYRIGKTLGTGGFSVVKLCTHRQTGQQFACKVMSLPPPGKAPGSNDNTREDIFKEIDIHLGLEHPNVIFLKECYATFPVRPNLIRRSLQAIYQDPVSDASSRKLLELQRQQQLKAKLERNSVAEEYFEEADKVYLIMELLEGGELLEAVLEKGHYSEDDARTCFVQIMNGIMYLHKRGIVHRDLKLENLLLVAPKDISQIKIADFGLAKNAAANAMTTVCGTPQYVAPEVIRGGRNVQYGPACDLWSMGVILFILLGGYPPFYDESEPRLFDKIRKGKYDFDDKVWNAISKDAINLIKGLLVVDPTKRLTCEEVMAHPWVTAGVKPHPEKANLLATTSKMRNSMRARGAGAMPPSELLQELGEDTPAANGAAQ